ncbi:Hpt domain-containing protein [Mesonia sp. K7]|uniref:Hpt domain-containing protein n=1 Tax=Mesonia sp. K7 TaxID=2218606 RepID=UPI000DAA7ACA|nr:Hpt domain-containing protein [Mesonia sp. K7]PZD76760.1 hypothetical protein DNG35_10890 [Mesonia sp. K7]
MLVRNIIYLPVPPKEEVFFKDLFKEKDWDVIQLQDSFEALQTIKKQSEGSWVVVMPESAQPLKAIQLKNYLADLNLDVKIIEVLETETEKEVHHEIIQISKPLGEEEKKIIIEEVNAPPEKSTEENLYSLNYLRDLSSDNEDFIDKMLSTFITSVGEKIDEMCHLLQHKTEENYKRIKEIAHSIKPSFEMLENHKGKNLCHSILHQLPDDQIFIATQSLEEEYTKIVRLLKKNHSNLAEV